MVQAVSEKGDVMAWNVIDEGGKDGHSMARTTGLVTAICTEMLIENKDVIPPGSILQKRYQIMLFLELSLR